MTIRTGLGQAIGKGLIASSIATSALAAGNAPATAARDDAALVDRSGGLRDGFMHSSDLRVRIVYSVESVFADDNDPNRGIAVREVIPAAQLVDQARGSTDPLVLDLMVRRCDYGTPRGCDAADFAQRWTEVDTQNQLAWLTLASVQKQRGDVEGSRTTFIRAAQASSWHEHYLDVARLVAIASPAAPSPRLRHAVLLNALAQAGVSGLPASAVKDLGDYCKEDGEVRAACARIVATMVRDTDTLFGLTLAVPFARRALVDPLVVASYRQESEAIHWSMQSFVAKDSATVDPDTADDETLRQDNARLQALIDLGERRLSEDALLKQHFGKSEAAARLVATMSPWQLEQRAKVVAAY